MFTDVEKTWKVEILNIPTISNEAVKVVNIVFVFDVPKDKRREVERRERERERERKDVKELLMAYVELVS